MKQFTVDMKNVGSKPIVSVHGMYALIDTGADIPVCCLSETVIKTVFNGKRVLSRCSFNSFGNPVYGEIYTFEMFRVGDLMFPNMHIFVVPESVFLGDTKRVPLFYFILSSSMFHGLIYEIDTVNSKLNVTVPDNQSTTRNLLIKQENGELSVLINSI